VLFPHIKKPILFALRRESIFFHFGPETFFSGKILISLFAIQIDFADGSRFGRGLVAKHEQATENTGKLWPVQPHQHPVTALRQTPTISQQRK